MAPSAQAPVLTIVTVPMMWPVVGEVFQGIVGMSSQVGVTFGTRELVNPDQVPLTYGTA